MFPLVRAAIDQEWFARVVKNCREGNSPSRQKIAHHPDREHDPVNWSYQPAKGMRGVMTPETVFMVERRAPRGACARAVNQSIEALPFHPFQQKE
ncbi:hypothetical protein Pr1d_33810 [Bythopirellula goksoeyrii]|uniref:Uncharacterized protein n=1 Tax=Bythopirellula goksoeyrii TaxID=1400387 RepID=A0A5B9QEY6_9BACT|nr:hypothetical protein Pr1d_33810 [Bythopirellula goksoeyrii]